MKNSENDKGAAYVASSPVDLEALGLAEVAYLKAAVVDGAPGYAIYAANGVAIGFAPGRNAAIAAVLTNDMEVASVH